MTVKSEVNELELKVRCPINLELSEWRSEDFITFKKTITNKSVFFFFYLAELCDTSGIFTGAGAAKFDKPTGKRHDTIKKTGGNRRRSSCLLLCDSLTI